MRFSQPRRFRAKPGAKYTYRYSTDLWEPEWGIIPTQKGRLIRPMGGGGKIDADG